MDPLALRFENARNRVLSEPVDLEPVDEAAQLTCDRDVALRVAETDRRRDVQRALAAVGAVDRRVAQGDGLDELAQRQVHLDRFAHLGQMTGVDDGLEPAAGEPRQSPAVRIGIDVVLGPVDHEHRAGHAPRQLGLSAACDRCGHARRGGERQRLAVGLVRPRDRVLYLLGRMGLGQHSLGPPLHEVGIAAVAPVVRARLAPPDRWDGSPLGQGHHTRVHEHPHVQGADGDRVPGPDEDHPGDPIGVLGRQQETPLRTSGESHADRALHPAGVHHVQGVLRELTLVVGARLGGPVRAPVAARVEADDPEVPSEVRDLRLPHARVGQGPRGQEQQRLLPLAVGLPEDPYAGALGESRLRPDSVRGSARTLSFSPLPSSNA